MTQESPSTDSADPDFIRLQYQFTRHIRNPTINSAPPGLEDRRLAIYRDLLFNNVQNFIGNYFPVIRKILTDEQWEGMLRDYFDRHRSHTPFFPKMPSEFLTYLERERDLSGDPPFLLELAHYEWVEAALMFDTRELEDYPANRSGDLLEGVPVLSPLAWPLVYEYPVQHIGPDFQPLEPPAAPTYIVVYRDRGDDIGFMELNPVTGKLLELIGEAAGRTGRDLLVAIAEELQHPDPQVVISGGHAAMQQLLERDVLLGVQV